MLVSANHMKEVLLLLTVSSRAERCLHMANKMCVTRVFFSVRVARRSRANRKEGPDGQNDQAPDLLVDFWERDCSPAVRCYL